MMEHVAIFGSTGSIGCSALDVIRQNREVFCVRALVARSSLAKLIEQAREFRPEVLGICRPESEQEQIEAQIRAACGYQPRIIVNERAAELIAAEPVHELIIAAIVGFAGFRSTVTALRQGKQIALANKESIVSGGAVLRQVLAELGRHPSGRPWIVPVDSEHSAIYQCLRGERRDDIRRIVLTASGGPFLNLPLAQLAEMKASEAIKHPRWQMGPKISVDSATLMNKGLEVIEAAWLFELDEKQIDVVIHPESIVHGMVEFADGAVMSSLAVNDMRLPIAFALAELSPKLQGRRIESGVGTLDFIRTKALNFQEVDDTRFPALALCRESLRRGRAATAVLNAANEVAVAAYLSNSIGFLDIVRVVKEVVDRYTDKSVRTEDDIEGADGWARQSAEGILRNTVS